MQMFTLAEIADEFGVTSRTIQNYVKEGMPKAGHGKYDLLACYRWRVGKMNEALEKARTSGTTELDRQKIRAMRADAEIKEYKARINVTSRFVVKRASISNSC
jgi:predicted transcriptional regulator